MKNKCEELLLENRKNRSIINIDYIVLFFVVFGVYALNRTSSVEKKEYSWLIIIAITLIVSLFHVLKNRKFYFGLYFVFQVFFLGIAFISRYWAISPSLSKMGFNSLLLTAVITFSVINIVDNEENCLLFIKALAWAGIFMFIYLGFKNGFVNLMNIRTSTQDGIITDVNANDLGMKCVISALSSWIYGINVKDKKTLYYIMTIILVILSIYTGSRKVIIMISFCFGFIYIYFKKNKRIFRFMLVGLMIFILFYITMNISELYNVVGIRIDETLSLIKKDNISPYSSTGIRLSMINLGKELFKSKPLLGYGLANAELFNNGTYLHNNYLELLVGIGLIGAFVYYLNPILSIIRNIKLFKYQSDRMALFFLMILSCLLILDYTFVSYNSRAFQLIIAVASHYYIIKKRQINFMCNKNEI